MLFDLQTRFAPDTMVLYPFRYRDTLTGKWSRARYKATIEEITARHAEWDLIGPAEIRPGRGAMFGSRNKIIAHAELMRVTEPPVELQPHLATPPAVDALEMSFARLFLRRYVTYCARRRRYAQMNGAARLHAELVNASPP
jgi:hypothetical protein